MSTPNDNHEMPAPSDRDLMRFYDGELDEESAVEIERWLAEDAAARDKRAGLVLAGEVVRELVDGDERADGIADAVMARLDEELAELEGLDDLLEEEGSADADLPAGRDQAPERAPAAGSEAIRLSTPTAPANDNARTIFGLAAAAAAVAAGLFLWGRAGIEEPIASGPVGSPPAAVVEEPTALAPRAQEPAAAAGEAEEASEEAGVQVAAVDFGSQSGSVFYVAGHTAQTAVVWVSDGGEEP